MLLLITDRRHAARAWGTVLLSHGIYHLRASLENAAYLAEQKDIGGVILDCVTDPKRAAALARLLHARYPDLPVCAIRSPREILDIPADRLLCEADTDLPFGLLEFCRTAGWAPLPMEVFDLYVEEEPSKTRYMGYSFPLSSREHTLLCCLFYRSPTPTSSDNLMSLCYPGERKSISNLAVTVRRINQRAQAIDPRPLIVNQYAKGYCLREGIV